MSGAVLAMLRNEAWMSPIAMSFTTPDAPALLGIWIMSSPALAAKNAMS
jgi:hypothetical protein